MVLIAPLGHVMGKLEIPGKTSVPLAFCFCFSCPLFLQCSLVLGHCRVWNGGGDEVKLALWPLMDTGPTQDVLVPSVTFRLTAFVLKSFAQARPHIFIEEKHIQDALNWLTQKQKENGCFRSSGTLLNNAMKVKCLLVGSTWVLLGWNLTISHSGINRVI